MLAECLIESHLQHQVSGAMFDFLGHLSTRSDVLTVGGPAEVPPLIEIFEKWAQDRGLFLDNPWIKTWNRDL